MFFFKIYIENIPKPIAIILMRIPNKSLLKNVVSKNKTKEYIRTIVSPNLTPILAESFFKLTFII